jgi:IS30 family transposase
MQRLRTLTNTNGLLRHYFPKSTDLNIYDLQHLNTVAAQLNNRPCKTLSWASPAEWFANLLTPTT